MFPLEPPAQLVPFVLGGFFICPELFLFVLNFAAPPVFTRWGPGQTMELYSAEYWLALAAECHAVADRMSHSITKKTMLRLAMSYERLAQHAKEQAEVIAGLRPPKEEAKAYPIKTS
jgi:hypothetical protein